MLKRSLMSLASLAKDPTCIEIMLGFDDDDTQSSDWCVEHILPELDELGVSYDIRQYSRLGYTRLHEYVNSLAQYAHGNWMMFWGDDAVMQTQDWDQRVVEVDRFRVLRVSTHNKHPYSIFPIVPRKWIEILGYMSCHALNDSTVSQIGYMLDIMHNIDVEVLHDRFDLTGNNQDETWENRPMLEGNPKDPRDFNHVSWRKRRIEDAKKLAEFLRSQGEDTTWFDNVLKGRQDPWAKMTGPVYDPNGHLMRFS